jgi:hypothetical protein
VATSPDYSPVCSPDTSGPSGTSLDSLGPIPIGLGASADLFCAAKAAEGASPGVDSAQAPSPPRRRGLRAAPHNGSGVMGPLWRLPGALSSPRPRVGSPPPRLANCSGRGPGGIDPQMVPDIPARAGPSGG